MSYLLVWRTTQLEDLCRDILVRSKGELPEVRVQRFEEAARAIEKTMSYNRRCRT
jgi:hypothetical protein